MGRGGRGRVGGGGGRVDVNRELKLLGKFPKNKIRGGGGREDGQVGGGGVGLVGGGQGGC